MSQVTIFEMGLRDGLQNESRSVRLEDRQSLAQNLLKAGIRELELGAFVREDRVPQMAGTAELFQKMGKPRKNTRYWALVPNLKGLERAIQSKVQSIAVFTAATESFAQRNIGMSIAESHAVFKEVIQEAKRNKIIVRGYLSTAFGCPFEGAVSAKQALKGVDALMKLGVFQVSIGDTIGMGTPKMVEQIVKPALKKHGAKKIALHFHDTRGMAAANALRSYDLGARIFDSSAGGLGGCPFAPGATGNLATEDLVFMFEGMGVKTGIDLDFLARSSLSFQRKMNRGLTSRYLAAYASQQKNRIANDSH